MLWLSGNKDLLPTECFDFEILESKTAPDPLFTQKNIFSFPSAVPIRIDRRVKVLLF